MNDFETVGSSTKVRPIGSPLKGSIGNKIRQNPHPPDQVKPVSPRLYGRIGRFDAWNVFVWTFEDFKKMTPRFEIVIL